MNFMVLRPYAASALLRLDLISYAFLMFYLAIHVPAADFWVASRKDQGVPDMQLAFDGIFGQGMRIIIGSLVAFLVSQIVDVTVFHKIKETYRRKNTFGYALQVQP